jgi:multicomponent Na+:H+ antiporter subunit D
MDASAIGILLVLIASTLLNTAYFAPVVYKAFFGKPPPDNGHATADTHAHAGAHGHSEAHGHGAAIAHAQPGEAPLAMVIPLCVTAVASVVLGFYPDFFMSFAHAVLP